VSAVDPELEQELDELAEETSFSGAVRVDLGRDVVVEKAYGLAHRGLGAPNEVGTRFALASGAKSFTALAVMSLVEVGVLELSTPVRELLADDLPLIGGDVTVEHLLAHRSGIGDYFDEDEEVDLADYLLPVPVHELAGTEDYLRVLDGHPPKFAPDERFSYSNGGYVVLALAAERAAGRPFHELVVERVCEPAGMGSTSFLRSDEHAVAAAVGYLEVNGTWRANVFHLPVRGSGDGGIYSTVADLRALWVAFFAGKLVPPARVAEMVRPRSEAEGGRWYGLGLWLQPRTEVVFLEGMDAGVSFRSLHHPGRDFTHTVVSNTTYGAWPLTRFLGERLGT